MGDEKCEDVEQTCVYTVYLIKTLVNKKHVAILFVGRL